MLYIPKLYEHATERENRVIFILLQLGLSHWQVVHSQQVYILNLYCKKNYVYFCSNRLGGWKVETIVGDCRLGVDFVVVVLMYSYNLFGLWTLDFGLKC